MPPNKRCLLWDWTNTRDCPEKIFQIPIPGPITSVANWNTWQPPELPPSIPFRPTIRTPAQLSGQDWSNILSSPSPIIHYLNEPERSGVTPSEAAELWFEKIVPLMKEKGIKVVGPSCASDAPGLAWLESFMSLLKAKGEEPDFLGLHYYGPEPEAAIRYLEEMHGRWPAMKVVVSEIACTSREYRAVVEFTGKLCNWMDEREWVVEYAFFGCVREVVDAFVSPEAQLMGKDGGLTELGVRYMGECPWVV
ncbi:uncharacterized protein LY89DRAFT_149027 [Mollisia scopiformis]|uniref:Asl1-like glycosyl hydrolase catalytic domain-containing protein n=1 Tax=Mollisia scopiformis TaxID=149040 RepID=A0A194X1Z8_MOLSC|nr:uncharacterized protein LY89DRAFT_149027 [Mollisia scopiformis]KUJ13867.1 hypothetical protein LY89DRAFT_149027 [Mollisia scopiformis]